MLRHLILWALCLLAAVVGLAWMLIAGLVKHKRAIYIAFGFDQTANAAFGGHWDEKISSRAWRMQYRSNKWYVIRKLIDWAFNDPRHCEDSYHNDELEKNYGKSDS